MGKLLVKLGIWMQNVWCKFQCKWNWLISKLIFNVDKCPVSQCLCKPSSSIPEVNMPDPVNMDGTGGEEDPYYTNSQELNK